MVRVVHRPRNVVKVRKTVSKIRKVVSPKKAVQPRIVKVVAVKKVPKKVAPKKPKIVKVTPKPKKVVVKKVVAKKVVKKPKVVKRKAASKKVTPKKVASPVIVKAKPRSASKTKVIKLLPLVVASSKKPQVLPKGGAKMVHCALSQKDILEIGEFFGTRRTFSGSQCNISELFSASCTKSYEFVKGLGEGAHGRVFEVVNTQNGQTGALKMVKEDSVADHNHEVAMQKKLSSLGLAPKIWDSCIMKRERNENIQFTFMQKVDGIADNYLKKKLSTERLKNFFQAAMILIMHLGDHKITHGDYHLQNIAYIYTAPDQIKMVAIDFGFATDKVHYPELDLIQLYRSFFYYKVEKSNMTYLTKAIRDYALNRFKFVIPNDQNKMEDMWDEMSLKHYAKYIPSWKKKK